MFDFSNMARTLVRRFGTDGTYRQYSEDRPVQVDIDSVFQVVDEETGAGMIVTLASFVKSDFPFDKPQSGDTLNVDGVRWKVVRRVEDEGEFLVLELSK